VDLGVICETLLGNDMAVESKFAPTYNMTLNLLRRRSPEEAEELLEQSFGQFQRLMALENVAERRPNLEARLADLRQSRFRHPRAACDERTLSRYLSAERLAASARAEARPPRRQHFRDRREGRYGKDSRDPGGQLERARRQLREQERRMEALPCRGCPLLPAHRAAREEAGELAEALSGAEETAARRRDEYRVQFRAYREVLAETGFLSHDQPTRVGLLAAAVYGENTLLVAQAVAEGWWTTLSTPELAGALVMLSAEDRNPDRAPLRRRLPTRRLEEVARRLARAQAELGRLEARWQIRESRPPSLDHVGYVYDWSRGVALTDLQPPPGVDPGDALRATKACFTLARQLEGALEGWELQPEVQQVRQSLERDLVRRV
jgi:superfamily II RNA helicase